MKEHRSIKHGPWIWMSHAAMEKALLVDGTTGLAIYLALCRLEPYSGEKKVSFRASAIKIARMSGLGERTVERHIKLLEESGLFTMASGRSKYGKGGSKTNEYTLHNIGTPVRQRDGTISATESKSKGGPYKNLLPKEEEGSSEAEETGSAGASPAGAGSPGQPIKKKLPLGVS